MSSAPLELVTCAPYARSALQYDHLLARPMLPWLVRNFSRLARLHRIQFRTVADVGCGTGRFVRFLAGLGAQVFGVDRAPSMLRLAIGLNRDNRSRFLLQDMRCLALPRSVDLITCNFDSLNYLLRLRDVERALTRFCQNLREDGHVIFDTIVDDGPRARPDYRRFEVRTASGRTTWLVQAIPARRLRRVTLVHRFVDGRGRLAQVCEVHLQRAYPLPAIVAALRRSGLTPLSVHDARGSHGAGDEPRVVVTARKISTPARGRGPCGGTAETCG